MAFPATPIYDEMRPEAQALVRAAITDAIDMINDMSVEGMECITIGNVQFQARTMLAIILDSDVVDTDKLPAKICAAIDDYIESRVGLCILS